MPFNFINFFGFILILISYRFLKSLYDISLLKFEILKVKYHKKKKRFKKYSFKSFFKGTFCIFYNKYLRSELYDYEEPNSYLDSLDNYEDKIKFTKTGKFLGKIYYSLGL